MAWRQLSRFAETRICASSSAGCTVKGLTPPPRRSLTSDISESSLGTLIKVVKEKRHAFPLTTWKIYETRFSLTIRPFQQVPHTPFKHPITGSATWQQEDANDYKHSESPVETDDRQTDRQTLTRTILGRILREGQVQEASPGAPFARRCPPGEREARLVQQAHANRV